VVYINQNATSAIIHMLAKLAVNRKTIQRTHKTHQTNNTVSAYALNILNNGHEWGKAEQTTELFKTCNKWIKPTAGNHSSYTSSNNKIYSSKSRGSTIWTLYMLWHTSQDGKLLTTMPTVSLSSLSTSTLDAPKQGKSITSM